MKTRPHKAWNRATADQTFDGSALKVDGNCVWLLNCLLLIVELSILLYDILIDIVVYASIIGVILWRQLKQQTRVMYSCMATGQSP